MQLAWDTTVASRAHGKGRYRPLLAAHARQRHPVLLPAPTVQEIARGLHAHARRDARFVLRVEAFEEMLSDPLIRVVPLDRAGALLAGELLALAPHPSTLNHRREGTRTHQRAAWALDVQIAACAFAGGHGVLTENLADFEALRDLIANVLPGVRPLVVVDARELAEAPA